MSPERPVYPFSAIVGQELMKLALVLNAIEPRIGGVLVRGEKGTAKSTAVRAFARLLPELAAVEGCPYGCDPSGHNVCDDCARRLAAGEAVETVLRRVPVVELPVGATEDRVLGSLQLEHAIKAGERRFEPGLLAAANRGILYVDEVNLLADHLVDVLLDAAAMGRSYVEREGISVSHPAQFILVGTMNPEEGDLRPQLLDRFALAVDVVGLSNPIERAEVVRRRIAFDADPAAFTERFRDAESAERERIIAAKERLPRVQLPEAMLELIVRICAAAAVDGLRADIVMYKTALALAAYEGRTHVEPADVALAARLVLPHRQRRQPFDDPGGGQQRIDDLVQEQMESLDTSPEAPGGNTRPDDENADQTSAEQEPVVYGASQPFALRRLEPPGRKISVPPVSGRRSTVTGAGRQGRPIGARPPPSPLRSPSDLALTATLRTAAPHQRARHVLQPDGPALLLETIDLQEKVRESRTGNLIVIAVDASGSMAARDRMIAVKGAVLSLLLDAYQKRDRVALIAFRGQDATLVLPPTNSVELAERRLRALPSGGRTPLPRALVLASETIKRHVAGDPDRAPWLILVSDGRPNVALGPGDARDESLGLTRVLKDARVRALVIDTESGPLRFGFNRVLADTLGAELLRIEELDASSIVSAIRRRTDVPVRASR